MAAPRAPPAPVRDPQPSNRGNARGGSRALGDQGADIEGLTGGTLELKDSSPTSTEGAGGTTTG